MSASLYARLFRWTECLRGENALVLRNFLLPMYCRQCGVRLFSEENCLFCLECWENSLRVERPFCTGCGKPHQRMVGLGERSNFPCAACRENERRPLRRIWGAAQYADAIGAAIRLFKFNGKQRLCAPLAELMHEFAEREMADEAYDYLMPVPLYKTRLRERGFNQSLLLAEALLPAFPGAALDQSLKRIRPTRAQSRLKTDARAENVRGAFAVVGPDVPGKRILLIDDVITTGGTGSECARALLRAGAAYVDAFAVALAFPSVRF